MGKPDAFETTPACPRPARIVRRRCVGHEPADFSQDSGWVGPMAYHSVRASVVSCRERRDGAHMGVEHFFKDLKRVSHRPSPHSSSTEQYREDSHCVVLVVVCRLAATRAAPAAAAAACPVSDQRLVDARRVVFSGTGHCFACHGPNAQGTALAPNLTDAPWLDIDGSYAAIAGLVRTGVAKPRQYATPMPALGGAALSGSQVCAVAAYLYSLTHR
jgi:mono/diheme cytochrome c family protein